MQADMDAMEEEEEEDYNSDDDSDDNEGKNDGVSSARAGAAGRDEYKHEGQPCYTTSSSVWFWTTVEWMPTARWRAGGGGARRRLTTPLNGSSIPGKRLREMR